MVWSAVPHYIRELKWSWGPGSLPQQRICWKEGTGLKDCTLPKREHKGNGRVVIWDSIHFTSFK